MTKTFVPSDRLTTLPPYIFSEINAIKQAAQKRGISLLSLAIGDPDLPTPAPLVEKMCEAIREPQNHLYSPYEGTGEFRSAVARWFRKRFQVELDSEREVVALIGSKEGIAHFAQAMLSTGDRAIYPNPGYPIFETSILLAGGKPIPLPLRPEHGFIPDPRELERLFIEHRPKYCLLNFPSNPTTVVCPREILQEIVRLAISHQVYLAYDNAYSEIYFNEKEAPPSLMEIPGAKEISIEFHSLSKTFNMTGWRLGFAVGHPDLVSSLLRLKTHIDSGPLLSVQAVGSHALDRADALVPAIREIYRSRRATATEALKTMGIEFMSSDSTFYIWCRVPGGKPSMNFTRALIDEAGLVITPGIGFGSYGEGFFRLALTVPEEKIAEALERLARYRQSHP